MRGKETVANSDSFVVPETPESSNAKKGSVLTNESYAVIEDPPVDQTNFESVTGILDIRKLVEVQTEQLDLIGPQNDVILLPSAINTVRESAIQIFEEVEHEENRPSESLFGYK